MTVSQGQDDRHASTSPYTSGSAGGDGHQLPVKPIGRRSSEHNGSEESSASGPTRRAKRAQVSRACARCRRLQKGCSESRPCQRCVKTGLAEQCRAGGTTAQPITTKQYRSPTPGTSSYDLSLVTSGFSKSPSFSPLDLPTTPYTFISFARESFRRQIDLLPAIVVDYCTERFFARLGPTIPILTPEYVRTLRRTIVEPSEAGSEAYCILLGMCALVLLQVEPPEARPLEDQLRLVAETNASYGWLLLEEALAAHRHLSRRSKPSFEHVLLTFFLYACHAALFHHSQAFFFLREATTLFLLLKLDELSEMPRKLAERLFWILIVSERSHAIRYRRPITLQITSSGPSFMSPSSFSPSDDTPQISSDFSGFWSLAALFRPLDASFIAILNTEMLSCPPSSEALDEIEFSIIAALNNSSPSILHQTQKANLRVTQLWLRLILWQVRLRLGQLQGPSASRLISSSRTYHYPLEVAKDLSLLTRDLDLNSLRVHGVGLTEKLFDIASVVVNVLARVPLEFEKGASEDDVRYLRSLIRELPGGKTVYESLLVKHLIAVLPGIVDSCS